MKSEKSSNKPGVFKWSLGGWFGAQIGGTGWLLLFGVLLMFHEDRVAGISITACFLVLNAIGTFLWYRRDNIAPYPATQIFLALIGGLSALTLTLVDWAGYFPHGVTASYYTKWLLIIPALMAFFHFRERTSRR